MKLIKFKDKEYFYRDELIEMLVEVVEMNAAVIELLTLRVEMLEREALELRRLVDHDERD